MDCAVGKVIFCSISKKERVLYSYNGGDSSVDSLARLCLAHAPPFHSHYFHTTAANRTFAFLCQQDLTYLLIIDSNTTATTTTNDSKPRILNLLHQIHHGFTSGRAEIVSIIKRLIESTEESMNRQQQHNTRVFVPEESMNRQQQHNTRVFVPDKTNTGGLSSASTSTKAPLLPPDRTALEDVSLEVEVDPDPGQQQQQLLMQKRRSARGLWWRHAKIVVAVDVAVCGVLFGIWMAVCRGFRCVS